MQIDADVTVYGWFTPQGRLWPVGSKVRVRSPMAMLPNDILTAETVTFTQDRQSGTRTVLHLVEPWRHLQSGGLIASGDSPAPASTDDRRDYKPPDQAPPDQPPGNLSQVF
jgi:hypothetical protein